MINQQTRERIIEAIQDAVDRAYEAGMSKVDIEIEFQYAIDNLEED